MAFQPAFNARLISEVRKYPCLYNHSRRGSGDTMERQRLWESIAKNIDPNCAAEFAKKRWLQLRDRYRKELKIAIKNGFVTPVRWCYFHQLSWLDPYLKDNIGQVADEGKKTTKSESFDDSTTTTTPFNWFGFPNLSVIKDELEDEDSDPALEASVLDRLLAQTAQRLDSISPEIENDESGAQSLDGNLDGEPDDKEHLMLEKSSDDVMEDDDEVEPEDDGLDEPPVEQHSTESKGAMAMLTEALNQQQHQNQKPSVETLIAANQARFAHHLAAQLTGMSSMLSGAKKSESAAAPVQLRAQTPPPSQTPHFHPYGTKETLRSSSRHHHHHHHLPHHHHHSRQTTTTTSTPTTTDQLMRHHLQQVGRVALEWLNDEDLLYSRIIGLKLKKMDPKKRKKVRDQIMTLLDETDESSLSSSSGGDNDDSCSSHSPRDNDEECHADVTDEQEMSLHLNTSGSSTATSSSSSS